MSSRFVPLSEEYPKGLLEVRGEILVERQIRQLREAGVQDITIVTGYKAEQFSYLHERYKVKVVYNGDYKCYNNISSIIRVLDCLGDTFICCSDHYYCHNVFMESVNDSYYAARFVSGETNEYCLQIDEQDYISGVTVGGQNAWYMAGHAYFSKSFSDKFKVILEQEYSNEQARHDYWEDVYIRHIVDLPMKIRRYSDDELYEFDTLDELRLFDKSYITDTRSKIVKQICRLLFCQESDLCGFKRIKHNGDYLLFSFSRGEENYIYNHQNCSIIRTE